MATFQSPPPSEPDRAEVYDLATPEETARRKRRRGIAIWTVVIVAAVVFVALEGKPARRAVKAWQARRAAAEAQRLMEAGQWNEASAKVQDAIALWPSEPEVIRTAAIFLGRAGHAREAAGFWKEVEHTRPLTPTEERSYAAGLLANDEVDAAWTRLRRAWPEGTAGTPDDWEIALQLALRRRQNPEAVALAEQLEKDPAATDRQRLGAAQVLIAAGKPELQKGGWETVQRVAKGANPESLEALLLLARVAAATAEAGRQGQHPAPPPVAAEEVARRIEAHPLAKPSQLLLASDLRLAQDPARRDELIRAAVERFGNGDNEALAAVGAWLYGRGEPGRVLEVIPAAKATGSRALFLQHLDALAALKRWKEVREMIEGKGFSLDAVTEQMYLARCATQLGQKEASEMHWAQAVQAAGTNVEGLLNIGKYAQKSGAAGPAEAAFRAAVQAAPDSRSANEALLGVLEAQGRTSAARAAVGDMLKVWPQDTAVRNDVAYLDALLNMDLKVSRDSARELMREEPSSLPHRVALALAELRLGHAMTALEAFKEVTPAVIGSQPRFQAVYAAVLQETGYEAEAKTAVQSISVERLLPEERELLKGIGTL